MRRGTGVRGLAALVTALGVSLLFCGSAWAKATQTISFGGTPTTIRPGEGVNVKVSTSSTLEALLSSETPSVCTVRREPFNWGVWALEEGTCTVLATQAGNAEYEAAEARMSFAVTPPEILLGRGPTYAVVGQTYDVAGNALPGRASLAELTPSICIPGSAPRSGGPFSPPAGYFSFYVKFIAVGTCTLAVRDEGSGFRPVEVQQSILVGKGAQTIDFTTNPGAVAVGGPAYELAATSTSGLPVLLSSATPNLCTVSGTAVHPLAAGTCTIDATQEGDANYEAAPEAQQTFSILPLQKHAPGAPRAGQKAGIAAKVRVELLRHALSYAWSHKAAEATEVEAVRTTMAKAGHIKRGASRPGGTPVYVVALEEILIPVCEVSQGQQAPKCDEAVELEYRASNLKLIRAHDRGESSEAYPDLAKLGPAVSLTTPREPITRPK